MQVSGFVQHQQWEPPDIIQLAQRLARGGARTLWLSGSLHHDVGAVLAQIGQVERELELGVAVMVMQLQHPVRVAALVRTLQEQTHRRVAVGLGVSDAEGLQAAFGIATPDPVSYATEYLQAVAALLEGRDHSGAHFQACTTGVSNGPEKPPHAHGLLLGALGPRMVRTGGRVADGVITWLAPPGYLGQLVRPELNEAARSVQRPRPRLVALVPCMPGHSRAEAYEAARHFLRWHLVRPQYLTMLARSGLRTARVHDLYEDLLDSVAVWGDIGHLTMRLHEYAYAGVDEVALTCYPSPQKGSSSPWLTIEMVEAALLWSQTASVARHASA